MNAVKSWIREAIHALNGLFGGHVPMQVRAAYDLWRNRRRIMDKTRKRTRVRVQHNSIATAHIAGNGVTNVRNVDSALCSKKRADQLDRCDHVNPTARVDGISTSWCFAARTVKSPMGTLLVEQWG